jgi:hypothetical protein
MLLKKSGSILIDEEGIILSKDIVGEEIYKKLE